ncbi:formin-like protein 6 [Ailuropoda melanoleuca]|uniref:formin-like protein 6 n=1 Tax=Ailuropoda melanoleuca TaxID=9646 RepID=UPI0014948502|nr:formin-like protein 6 [Ailuropoda melanoleuca]
MGPGPLGLPLQSGLCTPPRHLATCPEPPLPVGPSLPRRPQPSVRPRVLLLPGWDPPQDSAVSLLRSTAGPTGVCLLHWAEASPSRGVGPLNTYLCARARTGHPPTLTSLTPLRLARPPNPASAAADTAGASPGLSCVHQVLRTRLGSTSEDILPMEDGFQASDSKSAPYSGSTAA